jgi:hypothetical protein
LSVWLNTVFKTEHWPTGVTDLDTSLTNVNGDYLSHFLFWILKINIIKSYTFFLI